MTRSGACPHEFVEHAIERAESGRDVVTRRSPRAWAARSSARTGLAAPGVPWWNTSGNPPAGPLTRMLRRRPSGSRTWSIASMPASWHKAPTRSVRCHPGERDQAPGVLTPSPPPARDLASGSRLRSVTRDTPSPSPADSERRPTPIVQQAREDAELAGCGADAPPAGAFLSRSDSGRHPGESPWRVCVSLWGLRYRAGRWARRPAGIAAGGTSGRAGRCCVGGHRRTIAIVAEWWSIEVLHGEVSAFRWQEQHDSALIEAALTNGVRDGAWHADRWGVVFEVLFDTEEQWEAFRGLPVVRAALDAVPDPVSRGRGLRKEQTDRRSHGGRAARPRPRPRCPCRTIPRQSGNSHCCP